MYNLRHARLAKENSKLKVISVGGFRSYEEISQALRSDSTDFVALSRPFIREPDLVRKLKSQNYRSSCENCNKCAIMCDSDNHTKCYKNLKC
jgi:2,4-dienoyl-CoA reductase-like NADH-dependent reductase (Old Yellow Enzyme family)